MNTDKCTSCHYHAGYCTMPTVINEHDAHGNTIACNHHTKAKDLQSFTVTYKHPKQRKLTYVEIEAGNIDHAAKIAPREVNNGKMLYGIS